MRLIQLFLPIVTSQSPLSRSELLNSERPADKIAAFGWPGGVLQTSLCSTEKCSGNIAMEGLLDCLGGGRTVLGEGFSPSYGADQSRQAHEHTSMHCRASLRYSR